MHAITLEQSRLQGVKELKVQAECRYDGSDYSFTTYIKLEGDAEAIREQKLKSYAALKDFLMTALKHDAKTFVTIRGVDILTYHNPYHSIYQFIVRDNGVMVYMMLDESGRFIEEREVKGISRIGAYNGIAQVIRHIEQKVKGNRG